MLGFFQQGEELRHSSRALYLQGEELRNSVEQQRQLVEVSRLQLKSDAEERRQAEREAEHSAQPRLVMTDGGGIYDGSGARNLSALLRNAGPACSLMIAYADDERVHERPTFSSGEQGLFRFERSFGASDDVTAVDLRVTYVDARGNKRQQRWLLPLNETGGAHGDRAWGKPVPIGGAMPVIRESKE